MKNKWSTVVLVFCLFLSLWTVNVSAETAENEFMIDSVRDLVILQEKCQLDQYSENLTVSLNKDIDLTDSGFTGIPYFNGNFQGNGYKITGFSQNREGSNLGFFRYIGKEAVVSELNLHGTVDPTGSREKIGGLCGENNGKIISCSFEGQVSGGDYVGGLAGFNTVSGTIESSRVNGNVHGTHFVGGIAGQNNGTIKNCFNAATVNNSVDESEISLQDVKVSNVTDTENAHSVTDLGGICGSNTGVVRDSINEAVVGYQHVGYNVGGIAGSQRGYIIGCTNNGLILGRKEVGGIVGQMEPVSNIEYKKDTLQILKGQIQQTNETVTRINQNAKNNMDTIHNQMISLQNQGNDAMRVITELLPSEDNPHFPDKDSLIAAKNNLNSSISAMNDTMNGINEISKEAGKDLSANIDSMVDQMNRIGSTIGNASSHMGISVKDISDKDSDEDTTGKVDSSVNNGEIRGDINVGGIAGAMAFENDYDPEDDFQFIGQRSVNINSELRSVIVNSVNHGTVEVKKKNAGGIVGNMTLGLVRSCTNVGEITSDTADYIGGIAGSSTGILRKNQVRSELTGHDYVAGIAGQGNVLTDNRAIVQIHDGIEKTGGILGEIPEAGLQDQLENNYFLSTDPALGAVDGIDYDRYGRSLEFDDFMQLDDLNEEMKTVVLRFEHEDTLLKQITVSVGENLDPKQIPDVPYLEGSTGKWDLDEQESMIYNKTWIPVYERFSKTIVSDIKENDKPRVILTGEFRNLKEFELNEAETSDFSLEEGESILCGYRIPEMNENHVETVHVLMPEAKIKNMKVYLGVENRWKKAEVVKDGSYLIFDADNEIERFVVVESPASIKGWVAAGLIIAAVLIFAITRYVHKKKKTVKK